MDRTLLTGLTTALVAGIVAVPVQAQTTTTTPTPSPSPSAGTVHINTCIVKRSRNAGGFTYAYCAIVTQGPAGQPITVRYRSNLPTYVPLRNSSYGPQSKTLAFEGDELLNIKLAFKKLTVAQVVSKLKVTLSRPTGATITDATATAKAAS